LAPVLSPQETAVQIEDAFCTCTQHIIGEEKIQT